MDIKLINIGFGNIVAANRIISIISPESAPIKELFRKRAITARLLTQLTGAEHVQ